MIFCQEIKNLIPKRQQSNQFLITHSFCLEVRPSYRPSDTELRVEVQPTLTSNTARLYVVRLSV